MFYTLIEDLIRNISGGLGRRVRRLYYTRRLQSCGKNLVIDTGVFIQSPSNISLGDNVWIDKNVILIAGKAGTEQNTKVSKAKFGNVEVGCIQIGANVHLGIETIIQGHGGVTIGDYFTSSAGCKLYSLSNDPRKCKKGTFGNPKDIFYKRTPIYIGRNVWLGLNVTVIGSRISDDVFVKPNSVVLHPIEENSIAEGYPAKKVAHRF